MQGTSAAAAELLRLMPSFNHFETTMLPMLVSCRLRRPGGLEAHRKLPVSGDGMHAACASWHLARLGLQCITLASLHPAGAFFVRRSAMLPVCSFRYIIADRPVAIRQFFAAAAHTPGLIQVGLLAAAAARCRASLPSPTVSCGKMHIAGTVGVPVGD